MMMEHNSGCLTVRLESKGGMTVRIALVCATNIGPHDVPANALCTVDGTPLITADGYYLIVQNS